MEKAEEREKVVEEIAYERPRIEDYGTLAEITAGLGGPRCDLFQGAPSDDGFLRTCS